MHDSVTLSATLGAGQMADQKLSRAGVRGRLTEVGNVALAWRTGRVLLEASGTALRLYRDDAVVDGPDPDVHHTRGIGTTRRDAGDFRVFTAVRLSPERWPARVVVRFGTRLPTSDNREGLERDATDFYALVGVGLTRGRLTAGVESGIGLLATRIPDYEQTDVVQYTATASYRVGALLVPTITIVGQATTAPFQVRGNENLAEVRPGLQVGTRRWIRVSAVRGLAKYSPSRGVLVSAGVRR